MKSRQPDKRQHHDGITVPLSKRRREVIRRIGGYTGPINADFFEQYVWWWRRLEAILKNRTPFEAFSHPDASFFPKKVFQMLQFAYLTGDMSRLAQGWIGEELAARVQGYSTKYPGFKHDPTEMKHHPNWRAWRKGVVTFKVDFAEDNEAIVADFKVHLAARRGELFSKTSESRAAPKKQFLEADWFRPVEISDRESFPQFWVDRKNLPGERSMLRRALREHMQPTALGARLIVQRAERHFFASQ